MSQHELHTGQAISQFDAVERVRLCMLPSPLHEIDRIAQRITGLGRLFIKRDDHLGSLVGGNKLRKLEYVFTDVQNSGADMVISCGGVQSNHARITAMVARRLGYPVSLILNGTKPDKPSANFLINTLLGINLHFVDEREERPLAMEQQAERLKEKGCNPYIIPLGASNPLGSHGYIRAMQEVKDFEATENIRFSHLFVACSSAGTLAGMLVGRLLFGLEHIHIFAVSADATSDEITESVEAIGQPLCKTYGLETDRLLADLTIDDQHIGKGYAVESPQSRRAFELFAREQGMLLETTYTSKAAASLMDAAARGQLSGESTVLFWHTGGLLNLFT